MAIPYRRTIVGSLPWYSVLIVTGILLAVFLGSREEKRVGLPRDTMVDLALVAVPCGIIGARLYYVAMSWEKFMQRPVSVLFVWEGGLAIYGGIIGGALGVWLYARKKKVPFASLADIIAPGLLLAQAIGRWGNYFNMEAYGPQITDARLQFFPLAVLIPAGDSYVWHAATFFYESIWNLLGFCALWRMRRTLHRGMVFAWYLLIYGSGRFVIEQLRQDSLYVGVLRASQWLSLLLCITAGGVLLWQGCVNRRKQFPAAALCMALWMLRWMLVVQHGGYVLCMLMADVLAVWLTRHHKRSLAALACAVALDGLGLMMAMTDWPVSTAVALQLHAAICSASLLLGMRALTTGLK